MALEPREQFFPAYRRRLKLEGWKPKLNTQSEKRVMFHFCMPITGEPFEGFPAFLSRGFEAVEKTDSSGVFKSDIILEGMALEYFDTDKSKERIQRAIGVTLQGLELSRERDGESYITVLRFEYTVPWFKGLWKFLDTYWGMDLFCEFEASSDWSPEHEPTEQMKLAANGSERTAAVV